MDSYRTNGRLAPYIKTLIEVRARQLVGKAGFTQGDVGDIEQDLILDLLARLPKFNPAKATLNTFADRVVGRRVCNLLRDRQAAMRDLRREAYSMNETIETEEGPVERHAFISEDEIDRITGRYNRPARERAHLQMDVNAIVASLPSGLRQVAEMLRPFSHQD